MAVVVGAGLGVVVADFDADALIVEVDLAARRSRRLRLLPLIVQW